MSCLSAPLTNAVFAYLCICVFVFVYLQVRHPGTLFLRSLYHHLSENIWFVWSKTSYSGDKRRCYQAGQTNDKQWNIGLLSLWAVGRLSFANKSYWGFSLCSHQWSATIAQFPTLISAIASISPQYPLPLIWVPLTSLVNFTQSPPVINSHNKLLLDLLNQEVD